MFMIVDYVNEMTVKKFCEYGKYRSLRPYTFLVLCCIVFLADILFSNIGYI